MRFEFKNFGIIESASVELNGLTVLTGLNDSGKSFLTKGVFSIIKTIIEAEKYYEKVTKQILEGQLYQVYSTYRRPSTAVAIERHRKDYRAFPKLVEELDIYDPFSVAKVDALIESFIADLRDQLVEAENVTKGVVPGYRTPPKIREAIEEIGRLRADIVASLQFIPTDTLKLSTYFEDNINQNLFDNQICSFGVANNLFELSLYEGDSRLVALTKDDQHDIFLFEKLNPVLITDALIIETPTIIQLESFITNLLISQENTSLIPVHYLDLIQKLVRIPNSTKTENIDEVFNAIGKVIGGQVNYNSEERRFVFTKDNGERVKSPNIATGIKSFGILQRLISTRGINKATYLIIDEPEVHLHPQWEIEYARIIVLLSKSGIPILISTHSPYFIRAITTYTKKYETESITNFYYGEKHQGSGKSTFENVTENLEPILKTLAQPMQELLFNR